MIKNYWIHNEGVGTAICKKVVLYKILVLVLIISIVFFVDSLCVFGNSMDVMGWSKTSWNSC